MGFEDSPHPTALRESIRSTLGGPELADSGSWYGFGRVRHFETLSMGLPVDRGAHVGAPLIGRVAELAVADRGAHVGAPLL